MTACAPAHAALSDGRNTSAAVTDVAEAGETMPQKSTYFFPKLLTGVAFHSLEEPIDVNLSPGG